MSLFRHIAGQNSDDAHDGFLAKIDITNAVAPATASATAVINAQALAATASVLTPGSALVALPLALYGGRGASVTTPPAFSSDGGYLNDKYNGQLIWKLDTPRTLQYVTVAGQAGNAVVSGLDRHGRFVTETVTLNGTTVVHGTQAFAYIGEIDLPVQAAGGNTVSIGSDTKLQLPYPALDADSELRVYVSTVKGTNGTISGASLDLYAPNAVPDGVKTYVVVYTCSSR